MKANKPIPPEQIELTGQVVEKKSSVGSKSEHTAVFLETEQGSYMLRRKGANAFSDPVLKKLVGKKVAATGMITNTLFLANTLKDIS